MDEFGYYETGDKVLVWTRPGQMLPVSGEVRYQSNQRGNEPHNLIYTIRLADGSEREYGAEDIAGIDRVALLEARIAALEAHYRAALVDIFDVARYVNWNRQQPEDVLKQIAELARLALTHEKPKGE